MLPVIWWVQCQDRHILFLCFRRKRDTVKILYRGMTREMTSHLTHTAEKGAIHLRYQRRHGGIHQSPRSHVVPIAGEIARSPSPHGELALQTSERVRRRRACGTLTRRSRLIWLLHLPTSRQARQAAGDIQNRQFAARAHAHAHARRHTCADAVRGSWRSSSRFASDCEKFWEVGTNPLRHFNYIRQSPVRWLRAPASMAWNVNENIFASYLVRAPLMTTT